MNKLLSAVFVLTVFAWGAPVYGNLTYERHGVCNEDDADDCDSFSDLRNSSMTEDGWGNICIDGDLEVDGDVLVDGAGSDLVFRDSSYNPGDIIFKVTTSQEVGRIYAGSSYFVLRANSSRGSDIVMNVSNGYVGIPSAASYGFHVGSGINAYWSNNSHWYTTSDRRLKKNITPLTGALDRLDQLQPVEYEWQDALAQKDDFRSGKRFGFVAQDLELVFPSWVREENEIPQEAADLIPDGEKMKGIAFPYDYDALVIGAIKELRAENDYLKQQLLDLKMVVCVDHPEADACHR